MNKDTKTKSTNKIPLISFLVILSISLISVADVHLHTYAKKKESDHSLSLEEKYLISNQSDNTSSNKIFDNMSSINANQSTNSNLMNNSNCKNPDTESCYNSSYSDGKINPMTTCPEGYSKTYCNGYNTAAKSEDNSNKFQDKVKVKSDNSSDIEGINIINNQSEFKDKSKLNLNPNKIDKINEINNITNNQGISENKISNNINKTKSNFDETKLFNKHKSKNHDTFPKDNDSKNFKQSQSIQLNPNLLLSNNTSDKIQSKLPTFNNSSGLESKILSHKTFKPSLTFDEKKGNANLNPLTQADTDVNSNNGIENKIKNNLRFKTDSSINTNTNNNIENDNNIPFNNINIPESSISKIKNDMDQRSQNNAEFNINNSPETRITNEQIIKQSVKINNQVNNIIKNNQVNNIIRENTISAPRQPLTNLITLKLSNSSLSSGALLPLADVEPYRIIGGHITANLPSNFKQNIVLSQISDNGQILHAVILDLDQIPQLVLDNNSLYQTSLGSDVSGANPFTGNQDEVKIITNLFLWNNNPQLMIFNSTSGVTMNLIYK